MGKFELQGNRYCGSRVPIVVGKCSKPTAVLRPIEANRSRSKFYRSGRIHT